MKGIIWVYVMNRVSMPYKWIPMNTFQYLIETVMHQSKINNLHVYDASTLQRNVCFVLWIIITDDFYEYRR